MITMWIDYLGYATMHYCQVMVVGFCGAIEFMMMYMNANDGGPLEEAINESQLTIASYYVMMIFSGIKCVAGFYIYNSFKKEYYQVYGDNMNNDMFWNDSEVQGRNQRYNNYDNVRADVEDQNFVPANRPNDNQFVPENNNVSQQRVVGAPGDFDNINEAVNGQAAGHS